MQIGEKFWCKIACAKFQHMRVSEASSVVHGFFSVWALRQTQLENSYSQTTSGILLVMVKNSCTHFNMEDNNLFQEPPGSENGVIAQDILSSFMIIFSQNKNILCYFSSWFINPGRFHLTSTVPTTILLTRNSHMPIRSASDGPDTVKIAKSDWVMAVSPYVNRGNGRDDVISRWSGTVDCSSTGPDGRRFGKFSIAQLVEADRAIKCAFDWEQRGKR